MRKHKTTLAILLSVMMVFVMMPSTAFATVTWSDDYRTATSNLSNSCALGVNITFNATNGVVTANTTNASTSSYGANYDTSDVGNVMKFYDASNSYFTAGGTKIVSGSSMSSSSFKALLDGTVNVQLVLVEPSDAYGYNASNPKTNANATVTANTMNATRSIGAWNFTPVVSGWNESAVKTEQTVTITFEKTKPAATTYSESNTSTYDVVGGISPITITVKADSYTASDRVFAWDSVGTNTTDSLIIMYDGAEHKVVWNEVPGYSVNYTKYNTTTGKDDAVSEIASTNVFNATYTAKVYKANSTDTNITSINPVIIAAYVPTVGFDADGNAGNYTYKVDGTDYDAYDYLTVTAGTNTSGSAAYNAASAAAAKANDDLLKEYVKDYYEVKATASKANPNYYTLALSKRSLTSDETKTLEAKYKQMLKNFGGSVNVDTTKGYIYVNTATKDTEVEFTKAVSTKTYKGSKTTKKGKLKKNQTIQFTATTGDDATIAYKLINVNTSKITIDKSTGKVTIKKGLAKGTYKFKVKAYVPGSSTTRYEVQNVTVKVKK